MVKYQVFVSSTYDDLKDERAQVIKAILEMGHIPVGMEMFSAADEEQWKIIARQIEETDYYVVIAGSRYGSVTDDGISYTEKEYDYATSRGIPALGFVIDSSVEPLAKNVDKDQEKASALEKFKDKIKQRPVGFWKSAEDLHGKVSISLMKAFNTNPRPGWSRTHSAGGPEIAQELSRLSRENAELREELARAKNQEAIDKRTHAITTIKTLKSANIVIFIREKGKPSWDIEEKITLFTLFFQIAPEMMIEASINHLSNYIALMNKPANVQTSPRAPVPTNQVSLLLVDLASLDLVEPSKKKHPVSDKEAYWSLTQHGIDVLKVGRSLQIEKDSASSKVEAQAKEASSVTDTKKKPDTKKPEKTTSQG